MTDRDRFAALISEVAREVVRRRSSDACCGDLTLEQFETLSVVQRAGGATVGSLSGALGVELSTMSRNVSVLERNGYLRRTRDDDDGRIVRVRLTGKGRAAVTDLRCGERDVLGEIYARIPATKRKLVLEALEALSRCTGERGRHAGVCCPPVRLGKAS